MCAATVDEDLYSRQIYTLGVDAMKKISSSSVLISGMGGLGVEIAKNIILAGIKNVTIHDTRAVTMDDIASQFYLNESKIGQNRAQASLGQLTTLNSYVSVSVSTEELTDEFIKKFNCVVITDYRKYSDLCRISDICHANSIKLIVSDTRGVFGYIFADFGENFTSLDPVGERPSRFLLSMITNAEEGIVTCAEDEPHDLQDGNHVKFEEVEGMTEVNGKEFEVKVINSRQFSIGDTTKFGKYKCDHRSGYGNQVIVPTVFHYEKLQDALKNPNAHEKVLTFDFGSFGRDPQVVLFFTALSRVLDNKSLDATFEEILEEAERVNAEFEIVEKIDEDLLAKFANGIQSVISPMCAVFGGIAGQEVLKAVSSKFTPLNQFIGIGYVEALPSKVEFTPVGDRYDPYRRIFGNAQQEVMQKLRYFMLGAGALGCEMLKNWAMMGIATKDDGLITLTDMDSIERSNLNRQFLFRDSDIGKMKSIAAADAAKVMNNDLKVDAHTNKVGEESKAIYNDVFFNGLSGVCNALDNVVTRKYSDQQCQIYKKPLLESGTLGTKAHYQMIIPYLTETYSSQADPPEKGIPQCTLHNFPSNIDHCCMWARDQFSGLFETLPSSINMFLKDPDFFKSMRRNSPGDVLPTLKNIKEFMIVHKPKTYEDCARIARGQFEILFEDKINDLLVKFPRDSKDPNTGLSFWIGNKRAPTPISFSADNETIAQFVTACADILARIFSIPAEGDAMEFAAKGAIKPQPDEVIEGVDPQDQEDALEEKLLVEVNEAKESMKPVNGEEFEKDDDSNGHIDFIAASANLRAMNYEIKPEPKLEIKRIAGKIIPAIATTTAMICGFVSLEMYKVHSIEPKKLEDYRSGFINLAIDMFSVSEPGPCPTLKCEANGMEYKKWWTTWELEGDLTINEVIKQVKEKYHLNFESILSGHFIVADIEMDDDETKAVKYNQKLSDIFVNDFKQQPLGEGELYLNLTICCTDDNGESVPETPEFRLKVK